MKRTSKSIVILSLLTQLNSDIQSQQVQPNTLNQDSSTAIPRNYLGKDIRTLVDIIKKLPDSLNGCVTLGGVNLYSAKVDTGYAFITKTIEVGEGDISYIVIYTSPGILNKIDPEDILGLKKRQENKVIDLGNRRLNEIHRYEPRTMSAFIGYNIAFRDVKSLLERASDIYQ
ncbi:MAG TPA: hypothetical protein VJJ21_05300 [Candidatus Nanoarchaeia archaeon]|nr:hypothetical protein [Candidatus Nanoarchaeia archaeon]